MAEIPEIDWCKPGEDAAMEVLKDSKDGLRQRLKGYPTDDKECGVSCLHYRQISAQRCALEAGKPI